MNFKNFSAHVNFHMWLAETVEILPKAIVQRKEEAVDMRKVSGRLAGRGKPCLFLDKSLEGHGRAAGQIRVYLFYYVTRMIMSVTSQPSDSPELTRADGTRSLCGLQHRRLSEQSREMNILAEHSIDLGPGPLCCQERCLYLGIFLGMKRGRKIS